MSTDEARRRLLELMDAGRTEVRSSVSGKTDSQASEPTAARAEIAVPDFVTIPLSPEMREQMGFLAKHADTPFEALALDLLATELEAQVGLSRGPFMRKYMYR
jgi:hypothetical protein